MTSWYNKFTTTESSVMPQKLRFLGHIHAPLETWNPCQRRKVCAAFWRLIQIRKINMDFTEHFIVLKIALPEANMYSWFYGNLTSWTRKINKYARSGCSRPNWNWDTLIRFIEKTYLTWLSSVLLSVIASIELISIRNWNVLFPNLRFERFMAESAEKHT